MTRDLAISGLSVSFRQQGRVVPVLKSVDFALPAGASAALVGESGSGKTLLARAILGILPSGAVIDGGAARFGGQSLLQGGAKALRGREIAMVFQNPRSSLNPIRKIGWQIQDVLSRHQGLSKACAKAAALEALEAVRLPDPARIYHAYPFELSGGMAQRALIAIALSCRPSLLVADEPTTGLDASVQREIMNLIMTLARERGMSTLLITHDLEVAAEFCALIAVMRHGQIVEAEAPNDILARPQHPYTQALVQAIPSSVRSLSELNSMSRGRADVETRPAESARRRPFQFSPVLRVEDVVMSYPRGTGRSALSFNAVDGVSFRLAAGECLGLIGESGSGKSTLARIVAGLAPPSSGLVSIGDTAITTMSPRRFSASDKRGDIQIVFQDPDGSLNPFYSVRRSIADPLHRLTSLSKTDIAERVIESARFVGLSETLLDRRPHQLSGGQKARVGIARAIATRPSVLVLDEPTAALDVSVQALVIQLLDELRHRLGVSYLFITHHLELVRLLADRVAVMRNGKIVEIGDTAEVIRMPQHPYTQSLLAASRSQGLAALPGS